MKAYRSFITTSCLILCISIFTIACNGNNSSTAGNVSLEDASADVQAIYKARCISCHGTDLAGRMGEQTILQNVHNTMSYDQIKSQITNGGEVMHGFGDKLTEEEIDSLSAWLAKQ